MKYSTFNQLNSVLSSALNYWWTATSLWSDKSRNKEDDSNDELESEASRLSEDLFQASASRASGTKVQSTLLISESVGLVGDIQRLVARGVLFEALDERDESCGEFGIALEDLKKTLSDLRRIATMSNSGQVEETERALILARSIEKSISMEEAEREVRNRWDG